jgi:hypothetical protein
MVNVEQIPLPVLNALQARDIKLEAISQMSPEQIVAEYARWHGLGEWGADIIGHYNTLINSGLNKPGLTLDKEHIYSIHLSASQRDKVDSVLSGDSIYFTDASEGACYIEIAEARDHGEPERYQDIIHTLDSVIGSNVDWSDVAVLNIY